MHRPQPLHPISHSMSYVEHFVALCLFSGSEQLVGSRVCTHNLSSWDRPSTTGKGWEGSLTSPSCPPSCADLVERIRIAQHHVAWQLWCPSRRRCMHIVSVLATGVRQHSPGRGILAASNLQVSLSASLAGRSKLFGKLSNDATQDLAHALVCRSPSKTLRRDCIFALPPRP